MIRNVPRKSNRNVFFVGRGGRFKYIFKLQLTRNCNKKLSQKLFRFLMLKEEDKKSDNLLAIKLSHSVTDHIVSFRNYKKNYFATKRRGKGGGRFGQ